MSLKLHKESNTTIMKMAQWSSLTFIMYIHNQIGNISKGLDQTMSRSIPFLNISAIKNKVVYLLFSVTSLTIPSLSSDHFYRPLTDTWRPTLVNIWHPPAPPHIMRQHKWATSTLWMFRWVFKGDIQYQNLQNNLHEGNNSLIPHCFR